MQDLIHYRKFADVPDETGWTAEEYEGLDGLYWLIADTGAWTGPLKNWREDSGDFMSEVKKFDVVLTAGGNCGMYPRFYGNYFREVYTWEPDEDNFTCLEMNCTGDQYHLFKGGVGNCVDKLSLRNTNKRNVGTHKIQDAAGNVQMYRIDDLELDHCDLIHLDVENYERPALDGAIETIKKFEPVIITERSKGSDLLKELGYIEFKKLTMDTIFVMQE